MGFWSGIGNRPGNAAPHEAGSSSASRFEESMCRLPGIGGFTLVEILVSVAVLAILVVMVAQLTSSATTTTTTGRKRMDADGQARLVFDRMATDFGKMVKRSDVDYILYKNPASATGINDAVFFYCETPAYFSGTGNQGSVSLVGYRVSSNLQLERLGEGLSWDGQASASVNPQVPGGIVFLSTPSGSAAPDPASTIAGNWPAIGTTAGSGGANSAYSDGTDLNYHVLSDQVYRLEIVFLLTDGTTTLKPVLSVKPATWPAGPVFYTSTTSDPAPINDGDSSKGTYYAVGSRWYNTGSNKGYICTDATVGAAVWIPIGIQDISAIIVTIAILDANSRNIAPNKSSMVAALPDPAASDLSASPPVLPAQSWLKVVDSGTFAAASGIPQAAASQVRVYQRYFYINN